MWKFSTIRPPPERNKRPAEKRFVKWKTTQSDKELNFKKKKDNKNSKTGNSKKRTFITQLNANLKLNFYQLVQVGFKVFRKRCLHHGYTVWFTVERERLIRQIASCKFECEQKGFPGEELTD